MAGAPSGLARAGTPGWPAGAFQQSTVEGTPFDRRRRLAGASRVLSHNAFCCAATESLETRFLARAVVAPQRNQELHHTGSFCPPWFAAARHIIYNIHDGNAQDVQVVTVLEWRIIFIAVRMPFFRHRTRWSQRGACSGGRSNYGECFADGVRLKTPNDVAAYAPILFYADDTSANHTSESLSAVASTSPRFQFGGSTSSMWRTKKSKRLRCW